LMTQRLQPLVLILSGMLFAGYLKMLFKSNDNGVFAVCAQAA
jgi:hypothetical protein